MSKYSKFRWKGKWVSEAVYKHRLIMRKTGQKKRRNIKNSPQLSCVEQSVPESSLLEKILINEDENNNNSTANKNNQQLDCIEGHRIVELSTLARQMWCVYCKEALSLENIEHETHRGLASILQVRCHKCLVLNIVETDKKHFSSDSGVSRFDVNSKTVLGALHAGIGWTHLNKILSCLNIPTINFSTYKKYEQEVGILVEKVAKESCLQATILERNLTIRNAATIEKILPENFQTDFIIRKSSSNSSEIQNSPQASPASTTTIPLISSCQTASTRFTDHQEKPTQEYETDCNLETELSNMVTFDDVVRVMISYDMGWSKRGAGRSYDSLNGFGAIVGVETGLVLDYATCNRKCKKCDMGHDPRNHDCRKNFWGSAKAMEPHVAQNLVNNSTILKSQNVEVGVLIGDDDSSTIAACRATSAHPIVKFSDTNHASGGVTKELYKISNNCKYKELTKDGIMYLHRCFTYALTTNKGNSAAMAQDIQCIPYHAFNDHSKCDTWCGFLKDKENYDHTIIPGGFHDKELFKALKNIFDRLAENAQKFSAGASSNVNESLNASMASKAPKSRCYSLTASSDYRFASTIAQKNEGEHYIENVLKSATMSPGKHRRKYAQRVQKILIQRRHQMHTPEYKKRRLALKKMRTALRHRREDREGITYQTNCTLLDASVVEVNNNIIDYSNSNLEIDKEQNQFIVLLDLETSDLSKDCDILQIAAKCGKSTFATYINPKKQISAAATETNGLINCQGVLMYHGLIVDSIPLNIAMSNLQQWLASLGKPCYIVTHNLSFDGPRLFNAIVSCSLHNDFRNVVCGFIDTLKVIRRITGRKRKGECTITGLAEWQKISITGAHNAKNDVDILQKILYLTKITNENLIESAKTWDEQTQIWTKEECAIRFLNNLSPLKNVVGKTILKKMAYASITIDSLQTVFRDAGAAGIVQLLSHKVNGKPIVTNHKSSLEKIKKWLQENVIIT